MYLFLIFVSPLISVQKMGVVGIKLMSEVSSQSAETVASLVAASVARRLWPETPLLL
jgi:hypothetical protein